MQTIARLSAAACTLLAASASGQVAPPKFNVVFIISDQHKLAVTGCYGDKVVKTPNIDALAATGVKFTHVYTPSPLSAPARAAIITGTWPSTNGVLNHRIKIMKNGKLVETEAGKVRDGYPLDMQAWPEVLKSEGFATAGIGKMHVHGELAKGVDPRYPEGNSMGFDVEDLRFYTYFPGGHYKDWKGSDDYYLRYRETGPYTSYFKGNNFNQALKPTLVQNEEDILDFAVVTRSKEFMDACVAKGQPFFIHVGLEKPHKPWTTEQRFYDLYTLDQMKIPATQTDWHVNGRYPYIKPGTHCPLTDPDEIRRSMQAYYGCVSEVDDAVGRIVAETKRLGIYDKTIFVYTTDHGEHLFEHGLHEKHCMFEDAVNVPFIISCPALLPQGVTCPSLGSTIDVLPTIAELLGYKPLAQWEGRSLISQINAPKPWERTIFSEFYEDGFLPWLKENVPMRMLLDNKYKYIYTHGYIDQLFDTLGADPDEMHNLALDKKYADIVERYRLLTLENWVMQYAPRMTASAKKGVIAWTPIPEARDYTVWHGKTPQAKDAAKVGTVTGSSYDTKGAGGYWWITANWNLTQKGERIENVPMMTAKFPRTLPITAAIKI